MILIGENSQKLLSTLCSQENLFFSCVYVYKMVVENTKETQQKCGIKTVKYHNEERNIIEMQKYVMQLPRTAYFTVF